MIVDKSRVQGMSLLRVEGIIRLGESAEFFARNLRRILENEEGNVLLDLSRINHIDSTGIGELVAYLGRFGEHGRKLILVDPSARIRKLLELAQLARLFPIYEDLESALAAEGTAGPSAPLESSES